MSRLGDSIGAIIGRNVDRLVPLSGGSISQVYRIDAGNHRWCAKTRAEAAADFFAAEQAGLAALGAGGHIRVPSVFHCARNLILLEWVPPASATAEAEQALGRSLAALHNESCEGFGFEHDNYCGLTPQKNTPRDDGHGFFARCRLLDQGQRAYRADLLTNTDLARLERIADNLRRWIPEQPPSLIHGDLWRGNIHFSTVGPSLIDPACHRGWGEADLAMTRLFGSMDAGFYRAYREVRPLQPGFDDRVPLYNLYHLLNHLNLFGAGWLPAVRSVIRRFAP